MIAGVWLCAAAAAARPAEAADAPEPSGRPDVHFGSESVFQSFAVRTGSGTGEVDYRSRVTETLRLTVASLGARALGGGGLQVVAALRYDVDFGLAGACGTGGVLAPTPFGGNVAADSTLGTAAGAPLAPWLRLECGNSLQIQQLYVTGEQLWRGRLAFKAGRAWKIDPLGWFAYDGAAVTVRLPYFFSVNAAAGIETTNGLLFGRTAWERDGTNVRVDGDPSAAGIADRLPLDFSLHPSPFVSVGLAARGFGRTQAEIAYRYVWGAGIRSLEPVLAGRDVAFGGAAEESRIGWALTYGFSNAFRVRASMVADLLWPRFDEVTLDGSARLWRGALGLHAGVAFERPRLSASSIWYFFDFRPTGDAYLRADLRLGTVAWVYVRAAARRYGDSWKRGPNSDVDPNIVHMETSPSFDAGAHLAVQRLQIDVAASGTFGFGGTDAGLYGTATFEVRPGRLDVLASGYLYRYDNALQPSQVGLFGGFSGGLSYVFGEGARLRVMAEDNVSPFWPSNARLYGLLDLNFWL